MGKSIFASWRGGYTDHPDYIGGPPPMGRPPTNVVYFNGEDVSWWGIVALQTGEDGWIERACASDTGKGQWRQNPVDGSLVTEMRYGNVEWIPQPRKPTVES